MTRKSKFVLAAFASTLALATAARAEMVVALSGDATLTTFDTKTMKTTGSTAIKGANGKIAGIDVRPSDGMLYAVSVDGTVYTVDVKSGQATMKVKLETMLPTSATATVDFNPAADRLRLIGSDGTSLRANVDDGKVITDGKLKYAEGDKNAGKTPNVVAGAYSNSVKGTKETALYDLDGTLGVYLRQAPPNDGILQTLGDSGLKGNVIAFDIVTDAAGKNTGFAVIADTLYTVDIASGASKAMGKIAGLPNGVRDVAVIAP
jgi:outer membrane protein assembly factor BamB